MAEAEFEEAKYLYTEGELALQRKDKDALLIAQKALAKARLSEALARQAKAEADAAEAERARRKAQDNADRAHKERIAAENDLDKIPL